MTQEEYNRLERITQKDQAIDKIIRVYIPLLCTVLLFICGMVISRYCHAMQSVHPRLYSPQRISPFYFQHLLLLPSVFLFLFPGIRFEQDPLTIDRWRIIPHKLPSACIFGLCLYLFLTQPSRALPEEEALRLYRILTVSVFMVICISGRLLIYVLYHHRKHSPYFNKKNIPLKTDTLLFLTITLLPLIAAVLINYYFNRIAFPYRY